MASGPKSPLRSSFKHAVNGLRYYYRHVGHNQRFIDLSLIKDDFKLPVIITHSELGELFKTLARLKNCILLTLVYSVDCVRRKPTTLTLRILTLNVSLSISERVNSRKTAHEPLSAWLLSKSIFRIC
jgi:integrase/recombinase XerD